MMDRLDLNATDEPCGSAVMTSSNSQIATHQDVTTRADRLPATRDHNTMMLCGKHFWQPRTVKEPNGRPNFLRHERYQRKLRKGETRGSCLCDYHDFPTLLSERKTASQNEIEPDEIFHIMLLPVELRLRIFEICLVSNKALEFCPEEWHFTGRTHKHDSRNEEYEAIGKYHADHIVQGIGAFAKLLRVNKTIYAETAPILYGHNEFRFTNGAGWIALDQFLHQIGLDKSAMLRNITVCHPNWTIIPRSLGAQTYFWNGILRVDWSWSGYDNEKGFYYRPRWFDDGVPFDAALVLQKVGKLRYLRLVATGDTYESKLECPVEEGMFENLTITILTLRSKAEGLQNSSPAETFARRHNAKHGTHWEWEEKVFDDMGRYGGALQG